MELLAKCFHNASIKQLVEVLIELIKQDERLAGVFLEQCFREDGYAYLFEILLECTDATSRIHVGGLLKFILCTLKRIERERLLDFETVTETIDGQEVTTQ